VPRAACPMAMSTPCVTGGAEDSPAVDLVASCETVAAR
jgi:hypothetical protein